MLQQLILITTQQGAVATKLLEGIFYYFMLKFFQQNLHPTEAPRINKQKLILSSGNL